MPSGLAVLESRLGELEGCLPAATFSTGMSAITILFLTLLKSGDHIICSGVVYGGTYRFFKEVLEDQTLPWMSAVWIVCSRWLCWPARRHSA